jgi:CelD/BcsL family acetyltransferase involved in cellulose biosynthesis
MASASAFPESATIASLAAPQASNEASPPASYSFRTICRRDELVVLGPNWPDDRSNASPMTSFDWTLAAAVALAEEQSPRAIVASRDGLPRAIAPLARVRGWGSGRWEMLGLNRLNEPSDLIYSDPESLAMLVDRIVRSRKPLFLGRLPADSPTIRAFQRACRGRALLCVRPQAACPHITLDKSWLEPESHLNSRRRSDYRRAVRRGEKEGGVRTEIIAPRPEEVDSLLDIALEIEARSWKGAAGTALVHDRLRGGFLREYAHRACAAGTLRIALLRIGDVAAAMQVAVEEGGRWWLLKIGFDPALAACSPGVLLLAETLRQAVRCDLTGYEFLGTVEPWTRVWTEQERACVSVRVYPFGIGGMAALASDATRALFRRLRKRHDKTDPQPTEGAANSSNE